MGAKEPRFLAGKLLQDGILDVTFTHIKNHVHFSDMLEFKDCISAPVCNKSKADV